MNTNDLSLFGYRELKEAARLLTAYTDNGRETFFLQEGVKLEFNPESGNVFIVDEDYNVGMMNGDKLAQWFSCPQCGHEGFLEDMSHGDDDVDCQEYIKSIKEANQ